MLFGSRSDRDAPVLLDRHGGSVHWNELDTRIGQIQSEIGAARRLIGVEANASIETILFYLAALSAGHVVAVLPANDARAFGAFERDFQPDLIFRESDGLTACAEDGVDSSALHPDLALLLSTSGSTGDSKFVRLSRANILANAASIVEVLKLTPEDRSALILPMHYCYGLSVLHTHLLAGASIFLPGQSVLAEGFADAVSAAGCTNLSGVPHTYRLLEETGFRERLKNPLRFMTVAGGRLDPALAGTYRTYQAGLCAAGRAWELARLHRYSCAGRCVSAD